MGRPGLTRHPKFRRLAADLGSRLIARGALETLWDTAYENGEPYLGDGRAVELAAEWEGEPGALLKALLEAGGDGSPGFVEEVSPGRYAVHDLWDHAPDYVRKRRQRELHRRDTGRRFADDDRSVTGQCQPNGRTPAPAPAPAPAQEEETGVPVSCPESEAGPGPAADSEPAVLTFHCDGPEATWSLTESKLSEWQATYPSLDVLAECRKARQWIADNPDRRKTARGMTRYLGAWLARAQDSGRAARSSPGNGRDSPKPTPMQLRYWEDNPDKDPRRRVEP